MFIVIFFTLLFISLGLVLIPPLSFLILLFDPPSSFLLLSLAKVFQFVYIFKEPTLSFIDFLISISFIFALIFIISFCLALALVSSSLVLPLLHHVNFYKLYFHFNLITNVIKFLEIFNMCYLEVCSLIFKHLGIF